MTKVRATPAMTFTVTLSAKQLSKLVNSLACDLNSYSKDVLKEAGVNPTEFKAKLANDPQLFKEIQTELQEHVDYVCDSPFDMDIMYESKFIDETMEKCEEAEAKLYNQTYAKEIAKQEKQRLKDARALLEKHGYEVSK